MIKLLIYVLALVSYTFARESQLRVGKAVNIFLRYGYLSKSMKVISYNDTEKWLFKEPTTDIFRQVNSVTETEQHNAGVFSGDFHMEFCDNRRQLFQAYFRDYTVEWLEKPWEAFTGGWDSELAARRLGINTSYIKGDYSYILVRVVRYREVGKSQMTDFGSLIMSVKSKVRSMKPGNVTEAIKFMERFGTHYINSYTTGNSIYQVYVYNKQNYNIIKERLKVKGVSGLSKLDLYNFFAPWYAEHLGMIRSASGNATVEEWARKKLTYEYYVIKYITILKLQGNGRLLNSLDQLLGNEAILQLDLKSLNVIFQNDDQKRWFTEVLDNQIKLWEVNMNQKNDPK